MTVCFPSDREPSTLIGALAPVGEGALIIPLGSNVIAQSGSAHNWEEQELVDAFVGCGKPPATIGSSAPPSGAVFVCGPVMTV